MIFRLAADVLVTFHMAYVGFVVIGFILILTGIVRRWGWIRNCWFRLCHLACILVVVGESWLGITCPLTVWEQQLRRRAGQVTYEGDFIGTWIHDVLFVSLPPSALTAIYSAFGAVVLIAFVMAPPKGPACFHRPSGTGRTGQ